MPVSWPFPAQLELKQPVCVFCGSSPGKLPLYTIASESVGQALAKEGIPLVYGGGRRGIMGVVSQACLKAGGYVHGIVPQALTERASEHTPAPASGSASGPDSAPARTQNNQSKEGAGEDVLASNQDSERYTTDVVGSMHERKNKMAKLSQGGFIVLPGGYGTFEEALEMTTWNQLGIHRLPILILNIGNFYSHLEAQIHSAVEAGFITEANLSLCRFVNLEGGGAGNADQSRAGEWGAAAIKALKEWELDEGTGYGLDWELKEPRVGGDNLESDRSHPPASSGAILSDSSKRLTPKAIFTTMRYTSPSYVTWSTPAASSSASAAAATTPAPSRAEITRSSVPLLGYHLQRLREAYEHFATVSSSASTTAGVSASASGPAPAAASSSAFTDSSASAIASGKETGLERDEGKDGGWGKWIGDELVWKIVKWALEGKERECIGDWRVRVVLHPRSEERRSGEEQVEVQVLPAPKDAGPFNLSLANPLPPSAPISATAASVNTHDQSSKPQSSRPTPTSAPTPKSAPSPSPISPQSQQRDPNIPRRPLVLDPSDVHPSSESLEELDWRMYKTVHREMYDAAYARGGALLSPDTHPEVLLHTPSHILETTTSNIAILPPRSSHQLQDRERGDAPRRKDVWLTPRLTPDTPFLNGVMRRYLLSLALSPADRSVGLTTRGQDNQDNEGVRTDQQARHGGGDIAEADDDKGEDDAIMVEADITMEQLVQCWKDGGRIIGFNGLRGIWEAELFLPDQYGQI